MFNLDVPLKKPSPDIDNFINVIKGEIDCITKPPLVEYLVDDTVMKPVIESALDREWVETSEKTDFTGGQMDFSKDNIAILKAYLDNYIAFWYHMGYDFVRIEASLAFPAISESRQDTACNDSAHLRNWQITTQGVISNWEDFENYPWPKVKEKDFLVHKYICKNLPEGMGFISCHAGGVYEHVSRLMGYEGLCIALCDNRELVKAVADKIGALILEYNKYLLDLDELVAIFQGEDLGFKTQTLIPPQDIRELFIPWHKKYATCIHQKDKLYFLHSCGNVTEIMEDLINEVKIDAKHSFQDEVVPAPMAKKLYGDKIAILGGIDIDKLVTLEPNNLRKYVRDIIEQCVIGGRFALGSGNSIPSYIPLGNYLTMIDEALK